MRGGDDIDNEEVTIIADNGAYVGLGILTQDGREYWHIRTIPDALEGGTTPDAQAIRIPKSDVTILRGYQWEVLLDHHNKTALVLAWRAKRAETRAAITAELTSTIQDQIDDQIYEWEETNPMPTSLRPSDQKNGDPIGEQAAIVHAAQTQAEPDAELGENGCNDEHQGFTCGLDAFHDGAHKEGTVTWDSEAIGARAEPLEGAAPNELEVLEPEEEENEEEIDADDKPTDIQKKMAKVMWNAQCHSLFAALECALPTGHEELHTADADNEDAPTWDDEAQTGVMPF